MPINTKASPTPVLHTLLPREKRNIFSPFQIEETKQRKEVAYWIFVSTLLFRRLKFP